MNLSIYYVLDEHGVPRLEPDLLKWAAFMEDASRRIVAREEIAESSVSTVFLGIDHGFGHGDAILWETMVFGGPLNNYQDRCPGTREQAEAMHAVAVALVRRDLRPAATP